jgi:hypothetical protein
VYPLFWNIGFKMKDFGAIAMEIKRKFVSLVINKYIVCLCKSLFLDWVLYLRECKRKRMSVTLTGAPWTSKTRGLNLYRHVET